jgi:hypothetical protein
MYPVVQNLYHKVQKLYPRVQNLYPKLKKMPKIAPSETLRTDDSRC